MTNLMIHHKMFVNMHHDRFHHTSTAAEFEQFCIQITTAFRSSENRDVRCYMVFIKICLSVGWRGRSHFIIIFHIMMF